MPPSPRITVQLDEARFAELVESMGISVPPTVRFREQAGRVYGKYQPGQNRIFVFTGKPEYDVNGMRALNGELIRTLLHELRHRWQHEQHPDDFDAWYKGRIVEAERDAESFAQTQWANWRGVVKLKRSQPGTTGFGRMTRTRDSLVRQHL